MKPYKPRTLSPEEERLEQLLAFIQSDLATLRPGERLDLVADLLALRDPAIDLASVTPPDGYAHALKGGGPWPNLEQVQAELRAGITRLEAGQTWKPINSALNPVFRIEAGTIVRHYSGSYEAIMLASAVDLLVAFWPHIRRCELRSCRRHFLVDDERRRFHDRQCANVAREKKPRDYAREQANAARRDRLKKKVSKPSPKKRSSK